MFLTENHCVIILGSVIPLGNVLDEPNMNIHICSKCFSCLHIIFSHTVISLLSLLPLTQLWPKKSKVRGCVFKRKRKNFNATKKAVKFQVGTSAPAWHSSNAVIQHMNTALLKYSDIQKHSAQSGVQLLLNCWGKRTRHYNNEDAVSLERACNNCPNCGVTKLTNTVAIHYNIEA